MPGRAGPTDDRKTTRLRLVEVEPAKERATDAPYSGQERRSHADRRDTPTRGWDSLRGFHRRKEGRRKGERDNIYVDSYTRQDAALTVGVLVLNILDAFFTLRWLSLGGGEGNPLMEMLIRASDMLFLLEKCVVVGLWLIVLVIHKNFRIARFGLWGALVLYTGILFYHFALQSVDRPLEPGPPPVGAWSVDPPLEPEPRQGV